MIYVFSSFPFCSFIMGPLSWPPTIIIPSRLTFLGLLISVQWLPPPACAALSFNKISPQFIYLVDVRQSCPWLSESRRQGPCESSSSREHLLQPLSAVGSESASGKEPLAPQAPSLLGPARQLRVGRCAVRMRAPSSGSVPGASGETAPRGPGPHSWELTESALPPSSTCPGPGEQRKYSPLSPSPSSGL